MNETRTAATKEGARVFPPGVTAQDVEAARRAEMKLGRFVEGANPYPEEVLPARKALRVLAEKLVAVSGAYGGELATEGRLAWLYSLLPVYDLEALAKVLGLVAGVVDRVGIWEVTIVESEEEQRVYDETVEPAQTAAKEALAAFVALVDSVRARAPEEFR